MEKIKGTALDHIKGTALERFVIEEFREKVVAATAAAARAVPPEVIESNAKALAAEIDRRIVEGLLRDEMRLQGDALHASQPWRRRR